MNTNRLIKSALIAAAAAIFSSCYYDPSYGGYATSYGTTGVSASFVSTSSDYWFYDPVVRCYYDRRRSCYYDPYLYGYYPRGYTPRPISNCPHPYGWGGSGYAPVPRSVNGRTLNQQQDRVAQLRARNYSWANQVHVRNDANVNRWQQNQGTAAANFRGNQGQQPIRNQGQYQRQQPARNQGQFQVQPPVRNQTQQSLEGRAAENPYRREAFTATTEPRSQPSVDAVRNRNAEIYAQARQNQEANRQRASAVQPARQSSMRAPQDTQRQRLDDARSRRNVN